MARTNIAVDERIANELADRANKDNKTVYALANEYLRTMLEIVQEGGTATMTRKLWHIHRMLGEIDVVTLPADFMDELIGRLYALDREGAFQLFYNKGLELSNFLQIYAKKVEQLAELAEDFTLFFPLKKIEIRPEDGGLAVGVVGAGRRRESTECVSKLAEGILAGYGYKVLESHITTGIIRIRARRA